MINDNLLAGPRMLRSSQNMESSGAYGVGSLKNALFGAEDAAAAKSLIRSGPKFVEADVSMISEGIFASAAADKDKEGTLTAFNMGLMSSNPGKKDATMDDETDREGGSQSKKKDGKKSKKKDKKKDRKNKGC